MDVFAADTLFFSAAIGLAMTLAATELIGLVLGMSPSAFISKQFKFPAGGNAEPEVVARRRFFGRLSFTHLPIFMVLALLLTVFGLLGLLEQWSATHFFGLALHPLVAAVPAAVVALAVCNCAGRALVRMKQANALGKPQNINFVGRIATLTSGSATVGRPARARLVDLDGKVHHVLVEPDDVSQTLTEGTEVIVMRQAGSILRVATHPGPSR